MANAPTRPPNRRSERRTPPGGPHVARKSEVDRTRKHLRTAAEELQYSLPEVSATLLALAEPYGNRMLTVDRETARVPAGTTNLAVQVPTHLRKAIQDAAVDAADSNDPRVLDILGGIVSAGIRRVLDGEVTLRDIPREPRGSGVEKVNLNVPVDTAVLQELREALPEVSERLGFRATLSKVSFRLLLDEYGLDYEPSENRFAGMSQVNLFVPPRLAAAIRDQLTAVDEDLRRLTAEGYTKLLAGDWEPFQIPKAARGSDYERERLTTHVDTGLLDQVRAKARELKGRLGYRVTAQTIAIDYLISELGLEDLADAEYGITGG